MFTCLNPDTMNKNPAFSQLAIVDPAAQLIYVGGQNAVDVNGKIVADDLATQTEQSMKNVLAALSAGGATMSDVFKMTIYVVQGQPLRGGFAMAQKFMSASAQPPTISVVIVAGLANPDFLIEIEAVAAVKKGA